MKCTHCASDVLPDGKFCGTCGAAVAAEPCQYNHHWISAGRGKGMKCSNCGVSQFAASTTTSNRQSSSFNYSQTPAITPRATTNRETTLEDVVRASNRTTHAVRAFALLFFWQFIGVTVAALNYGIAFSTGDGYEPNGFALFLAVIAWILGTIRGVVAFQSELKKSDMTDSYRL